MSSRPTETRELVLTKAAMDVLTERRRQIE